MGLGWLDLFSFFLPKLCVCAAATKSLTHREVESVCTEGNLLTDFQKVLSSFRDTHLVKKGPNRTIPLRHMTPLPSPN